jgi:hypothetical protein
LLPEIVPHTRGAIGAQVLRANAQLGSPYSSPLEAIDDLIESVKSQFRYRDNLDNFVLSAVDEPAVEPVLDSASSDELLADVVG